MAKRGITVYNPTGVSDVQHLDMAHRVEDLYNKRLGVLWNEKPNGDILLRRLQERLAETFDFPRALWLQKPSGSAASPEVLQTLSEECDVVLNAMAD